MSNNVKIHNLFLVFAIIFFLISVTWFFVFGNSIHHLDSDYSFNEFLIHNDNTRFQIGADWDGLTISSTSINEDIKETGSSQVELDRNFIVETLNGDLIYEVNQEFIVNKITKKTIKGKDDKIGDIFAFFPHNVQKQDYIVYIPGFIDPIHFSFNQTKKINDIEVYHFQAKNQESNDTAGYEFLELVPTSYYVISVYTMDVYVEPNTGIIFDYEDNGISYYVDKESREKIWAMDQWGNSYGDNTLKRKIEFAESIQQNEFIYKIIIPSIFLIFSFVSFLAFIIYKNKGKSLK